ncbi:Uncharacterized protein dnl_53410 [Desulfonema limicola]|uniref:Uncharacterized protein n=1 Tax=Desulfonema limicola TaxID=45656 RepID=A0A975BC93_9BACT|nr:hypothetical protein [Desulfonema limicola]QTA82954.1 Uncharacterized protein dnl_53410 [Desulfonema limicola]
MLHSSEKFQYLMVEDIQQNPLLIANLILKGKDVSIIFEKEGDRVRFTYLKTYSREAARILEEAKNEYKELEIKGYTREQAFEDFTEARNEISKYL